MGRSRHRSCRRLAIIKDPDVDLSRKSWLQGRKYPAGAGIAPARHIVQPLPSPDRGPDHQPGPAGPGAPEPSSGAEAGAGDRICRSGKGDGRARFRKARSEEHTSELQSLMRISYAVFCLKKKTTLLHTHIYLSSSYPTHILNY